MWVKVIILAFLNRLLKKGKFVLKIDGGGVL